MKCDRCREEFKEDRLTKMDLDSLPSSLPSNHIHFDLCRYCRSRFLESIYAFMLEPAFQKPISIKSDSKRMLSEKAHEFTGMTDEDKRKIGLMK